MKKQITENKKQETEAAATTKTVDPLAEELKAALKMANITEWTKTSSRGIGRKTEILRLFKEQGPVLTMDYISGVLGISKKNVSSQFTYLRKDGYDIRTQKQDNIFFAKMM